MIILLTQLSDAQEIIIYVVTTFVKTFGWIPGFGTSDSDLSDFDPDIFGCGEITTEIENMVENQ